MENFNQLSPLSQEATYIAQRLPHFRDNKLIEALPAPLTDAQLIDLMTSLPEYSPEQLEWTAHERIQLIMQLSHFSIPMKRHMELGRKIDSMLREGYVGCDISLLAKSMTIQKTIDFLKLPDRNYHSILRDGPQLSSLLMGLPGMGKSTSTKKLLSAYPRVIYHPTHNLYQIPYLRVELPSDGMSVKEMCLKIFSEVDKRIPGVSYRATYQKLSQRTAGELLEALAKVMINHVVGILVVDEIQNLTNAKKTSSVLMTELVSICNCLSVPILFIGTNKAVRLFSSDFHHGRRACGKPWNGLENPFHEDSSEEAKAEWNEFAGILFHYQWVKHPVPFDAHFSRLLYDYSAGVFDIAIKLFAAAQTKAIHDRSERITTELLRKTYIEEFPVLHNMLDALRNGDLEQLATFPDIAPTNLQEVLQGIEKRLSRKSNPAFSVKPDDKTFIDRVAASLVAAGHDEEVAVEVAAEVASHPNVRNVRDGVNVATKLLASPPSLSKPKKAKPSEALVEPANVEYEPLDYRYAIQKAQQSSTKIYAQLQAEGIARPLEELLEL